MIAKIRRFDYNVPKMQYNKTKIYCSKYVVYCIETLKNVYTIYTWYESDRTKK